MFNQDIFEDIFFNGIIPEANRSEVTINETDGYEHIYNIGFNACVEGKLNSGSFDDPKPILMINNKKQLLNMLEKYILEVDKTDNYFSNCEYEQKIKAYMSFVWNNAIYEDFANPCAYLKKQIDFLQTPKLELGEFTYAENIDFSSVLNSKNKDKVEMLNGSDIVVNVKRQGIKKEAPYAFEVKVVQNATGEEYLLPTIRYGISNDECYIYAIHDQNKSDEKESRIAKSVDKVFATLNDGIESAETDEFNELEAQYLSPYNNSYLNEDNDLVLDYFPENISRISPMAIVSLTVFLDSLLKHKIDKIKVVSCLPVRYYGKELFYLKKHLYITNSKNLTKEDSDKLLLEYKKEHLRIQKNLSEKIIRNFRRLTYHFDNCAILLDPFDYDEHLHFRTKEFTNSNSPLLNCIMDSRHNSKTK